MSKLHMQGFSMVEVLVMLTVFSLVTASVMFMFIGGLRAWNAQDDHSELLHNQQNVITQISRMLERARDIKVAEAKHIEFTRELGQAAGTERGAVLLRPRSASWQMLNGEGPGVIPAGVVVFDILQLTDTTLLAAGNDGCIYRSTDAGRSWGAVKLGDATEVRDIEAVADTLYAATGDKGNVYKSTDAGLSWSNTGELAGAVTVRSLASNPAGTVWAGVDHTGAFNLFTSTDGGATWTGTEVFPLSPGTWAYRMPVVITNSTSQNLTDYQVRVQSAFMPSKMKTDFSDLRFRTAADVDLPYWLEAYQAGVSAVLWVKVSQINAKSSTTIYMYYGNPSADSVSDITTTMDPAYTRYDIPYEWTDKTVGTPLVSADDDGAWVNLPYQFPFWREFRNSIYVCSNGYLSFGDSYGNDDAPQNNNFRNRPLICPCWSDLRTDLSYGQITDPGVFVDSYPDHTVYTCNAVSFEVFCWEWLCWRAELRSQVLTCRNGDIKISYQLVKNAGSLNYIAGLSKGNGSNSIEITSDVPSDVPPGVTFLFGTRQYVSPEPTSVLGPEEVLASGSDDVLSLCYANAVLYAGTSGGDVLYSTDGGTGWNGTAQLAGVSFVHRLFASNGTLYAGTEPAGVIFRTDNRGSTWTTCAPLPGADALKAIDETLYNQLICGASPTGSINTSAASGDSWDPLGAPPGVSAVYCLQPLLELVGFSWSGNKYQDTGNRDDQVLRQSSLGSKTIDNGYTRELTFEYFNSDMSPADTSSRAGRARIATVRITVESSSDSLSISGSVSITLRNRQ